MNPAYGFHLPPLPKPDYQALKTLCQALSCSQLDVVRLGIQLAMLALEHEDGKTHLANHLVTLRGGGT